MEGIIDAEKEAKMKKSINEIGTHAGTDTKLKAAAEATSVAQSGSKYMDTNFEKLTTALKGTFGATDVKELNAYFLNHNIKDDKERAALIKMYKGEAMDATEKERAWNANTKLGTTNGASNPGTP